MNLKRETKFIAWLFDYFPEPVSCYAVKRLFCKCETTDILRNILRMLLKILRRNRKLFFKVAKSFKVHKYTNLLSFFLYALINPNENALINRRRDISSIKLDIQLINVEEEIEEWNFDRHRSSLLTGRYQKFRLLCQKCFQSQEYRSERVKGISHIPFLFYINHLLYHSPTLARATLFFV